MYLCRCSLIVTLPCAMTSSPPTTHTTCTQARTPSATSCSTTHNSLTASWYVLPAAMSVSVTWLWWAAKQRLHGKIINTKIWMKWHRSEKKVKIVQLSQLELLCTSNLTGITHGDELFYLFRGGPRLTPPNAPSGWLSDLQRPDDLALRNIITTLWTNFAATG